LTTIVDTSTMHFMTPQTLLQPRESQNGHAPALEVKNDELQCRALLELLKRKARQKVELAMKSLEERHQAIGTGSDREKMKPDLLAIVNVEIAAYQALAQNIFDGSLDQELDRIFVKNHPPKRISCDKQEINLCAEQFDGKRRGTFLRIAYRLFDNGIVEEDLISALNTEGFPGEYIATQLRQNCWQQNHRTTDRRTAGSPTPQSWKLRLG